MSRSTEPSMALFLILTLAISAIFWALIISAGHIGAGAGMYVSGLMWSPAAAAFLTLRLSNRDYGSLGLRWGGARYAAVSYLLPLAYAAVAYVLVWVLQLGTFPDADSIAAISHKLGWPAMAPAAFLLLYLLLLGSTQIVTSVAHALGEEIGWRGFWAPRLVARMGFKRATIVIGLVWGLWHLPLLLFADYNSGTPWWFGFPCFCALTVGSTVIMTWLRLKSNSVWPAAIVHASHNLFIQNYFTPLTGSRGEVTKYAIDEFGLAVPLLILMIAACFWVRRPADIAMAPR